MEYEPEIDTGFAGLEVHINSKILRSSLRKTIQNYKYKISYRPLEGAPASEGP